MTGTVGYQPTLLRLALIDGQDFTHTFEPHGDLLPDGAVVSLQLLNRDRTRVFGAWPLTETGSGWVVVIDAPDHANVPHGSWWRLFVTYPAGGGRFCWIAGPVERNRR